MKTYVHLWYYIDEFFLKWEIFQTNLKIKTRFISNNIFSENRVVYEVMWENMEQPYRPQMTIWHGAEKMQFACRITKAKIQTHTSNI